MLKQNYLIYIGVAIGVIGWLLLSGCAGRTPYSEDSGVRQNWGNALETAHYNQLHDPDAFKNLRPPDALYLDGNASQHKMDKYIESFKDTEVPQSSSVLKLSQ